MRRVLRYRGSARRRPTTLDASVLRPSSFGAPDWLAVLAQHSVDATAKFHELRTKAYPRCAGERDRYVHDFADATGAGAKHDDLVRKEDCFLHAVCDEQHGSLLGELDFVKQLLHVLARLCV